MTGGGLCEVCQAEAQQACSGCASVFYCGKEHQRKHWPNHRQECQPYKVVSSPDAGQYLVAGCQLKAGQRILRDTPLIVAPLATSTLLCLGCSAAIVSDDFVKCPQCEWPLCSPECATSKFHTDECPILARDSKKIGPPKELKETPRYDIIMVMRCILLQSADPSSWKVLLSMASHVEQRKAAQDWHHKSTVYYLTEILHVDCDADTVHQVRSAIATNAIEIMSEKGTRLRALYPRIRLLNHSCVPNTHLTSESDGVMEVRTAISVNSGEPLHICYTGTTMPLWERQASLHNSYYFTCACSRCEDPTELGTYFSSPKCPECKGFYLEPSRKLEEIMWVCQNCKIEQNNSVMKEKVDEWLCKIETDDLFEGSSAKEVKAVLDYAERTFHPCHYIWMKVAQLTLWKMRDNSPTIETLKLRRDIWIRLLELYSTFEPGLTRRRGMSLMETGTAIFNASVREYKENSESFLPQCTSQMEPAVKYFQEASYILGLDSPESYANAIAKRAEIKKRQAEEFLARMNGGNLRAE